jgi:orotidine 5''-phosphate decarboxylase, subfamily 1
MNAKDRLIVALDVVDVDRASQLVKELKGEVGMFKVGSMLFATAGPQFVKSVLAEGNKVFLDLKLHDIPFQISGAAEVIGQLGVALFTLHASGGAEMIRRSVEAVADGAIRANKERPKVLAVSVLTSLDTNALVEIGISGTPSEAVERLVKLAEVAGVDGAVCSPKEAAAVRSFTAHGFLIVTPGVRPASSQTANEDQKRVDTPAAALSAGADYIVVGRPVTAAANPVDAARRIVAEIQVVQNDGEQAGAVNV